jgi:hypothetical protein
VLDRQWLETNIGHNLCVCEVLDWQRIRQGRLHLLVTVPVDSVEVDSGLVLHLLLYALGLRETIHALLEVCLMFNDRKQVITFCRRDKLFETAA